MTRLDYILRQYFLGRSAGYIANELGEDIDVVKRALTHARRAKKRRATAMLRSTRYEIAEKIYEALKSRGYENGTPEEQAYWRSQTLAKRGRPTLS